MFSIIVNKFHFFVYFFNLIVVIFTVFVNVLYIFVFIVNLIVIELTVFVSFGTRCILPFY
ncbi:hypothetical protein T190115A13A_250001 [Tenacibaculum sp. 190524A02b]|uniref:ATP synthase subunit A n=1 Tax=Tenacibaculum vairaonense TaxID=3137860 RepID=A0ABM9PLS4_9FLAO